MFFISLKNMEMQSSVFIKSSRSCHAQMLLNYTPSKPPHLIPHSPPAVQSHKVQGHVAYVTDRKLLWTQLSSSQYLTRLLVLNVCGYIQSGLMTEYEHIESQSIGKLHGFHKSQISGDAIECFSNIFTKFSCLNIFELYPDQATPPYTPLPPFRSESQSIGTCSVCHRSQIVVDAIKFLSVFNKITCTKCLWD